MKLEDFLDSYIIMKNLTGFDWTFWKKGDSEKFISFYIETEEKVEINLIKPKSADLILLQIHFPNSKHKGVDIIETWKLARPELTKTYSYQKTKGRAGTTNIRVSVGIKDVDELKKFLDKVF